MVVMDTPRRKTRPRGFAPWQPRDGVRQVVDAVQTVLDEYHAHLPLTIRQIFYRLVAQEQVDKTERGYKSLCETLNRARRARLIPFDSIRDDGFVERTGFDFATYDDAAGYLASIARYARFDMQAGQPRRLALWCEAQGMVPQLERIGGDYGIAVLSSGGFDSLTAKHDMALKLSHEPHEVLHVGDYDPSGEHVHLSLGEDLHAFAREWGGDITLTRIAITCEQIERLRLPSAPPKKSDNRSFSGTRTVQAEALPPDELARIVRDTIESRLDVQALEKAQRLQVEWRKALVATVGAR